MENKTRAYELVERNYLGNLKSKKESRIGVEFEYLLISKERVSFKQIGKEFMESLLEMEGFNNPLVNDEGIIARIDVDGDSFSFDAYYSTLEFSICPLRNLNEIYERWNKYIHIAKDFYEKRGIFLSGIGENRYHDIDFEGVKDNGIFYIVKSIENEYSEDRIKKYIAHISSIQTHLDIKYEDFLKAYNLFNELCFADALLFANSPATADGRDFLLYRDEEWRQVGFEAAVFDQKFEDFDELINEIIEEKQYITVKDGKVCTIVPQSLKEYYSKEDSGDEEFKCFRSFRKIIMNKLGCLEFRGDCIQPVNDCLVTTAFHLGISEKLDEAAIIVKQMKDELNLTQSNSQLRESAMRGEDIGDKEILQRYLRRLYECAYKGLKDRGFSEEKYLLGLSERIDRFESPAKTFIRKMKEGKDVFELEKSLGSGSL